MTGARLYGARLFASHKSSLRQCLALQRSLETLAQPFYQLPYQRILLKQAKREQEMARVVMLQSPRSVCGQFTSRQPDLEGLSDRATELWPRLLDDAEDAFLKRQIAVAALSQLNKTQNNADLDKYTYQGVIDAIHEANDADIKVSSTMILLLRAGYTDEQFQVAQRMLTALIKQELAHSNTVDLLAIFKKIHGVKLFQDEIIKQQECQLPIFVDLHREMMVLQLALPPLHAAYYAYHSLVVHAVTECEFTIRQLQHLTSLLEMSALSQDIARATLGVMIHANRTYFLWEMTKEMAEDIRRSCPVDFVRSSRVPPFICRLLNKAKQHQVRLVSTAACQFQIIAEWASNVGALKRAEDGWVAVDHVHLGQYALELQNYYYAMERAVRSREDASCAIDGAIAEVKA